MLDRINDSDIIVVDIFNQIEYVVSDSLIGYNIRDNLEIFYLTLCQIE